MKTEQERLCAAHQSTVDGLKADKEALVGELEKKLSSQSLKLRATQDDLVKVEAALESTSKPCLAHLTDKKCGSSYICETPKLSLKVSMDGSRYQTPLDEHFELLGWAM